MNDSPQGLGLVSRRNLLRAAGLGGGLLLVATGASAQAPSSDVVVTIKDAKVFDGRWVLEADTVIVEGSTIIAVGRGLAPRGKLIEGGEVFGHPGLPELSTAMIEEAVAAAHDHGKMALAHALTIVNAERAVRAGVDGLAHIFIDRPHTNEIVRLIARSHTFVTPC